jgi:hypothetical protein
MLKTILSYLGIVAGLAAFTTLLSEHHDLLMFGVMSIFWGGMLAPLLSE